MSEYSLSDSTGVVEGPLFVGQIGRIFSTVRKKNSNVVGFKKILLGFFFDYA